MSQSLIHWNLNFLLVYEDYYWKLRNKTFFFIPVLYNFGRHPFVLLFKYRDNEFIEIWKARFYSTSTFETLCRTSKK